jgi:hypothetical protein
MSEQALQTKIRKLELENQKLRKNKIQNNNERRRLRFRVKEITENRDKWRTRSKTLSEELEKAKKSIKNVVLGDNSITNIARHQYSDVIIKICVSACILGNCGLRSSVKVVSSIALILNLELGKIPSKSSISNWIKKIGYSVYMNSISSIYENGYGLIIDESMVVGQERMFVVLGIASSKVTESALSFGEIKIMYIGVSGSWSGSEIAEVLQEVTAKQGKKPDYVISDKGCTMIKGISDAGLIRVADVGHEIARLTELRYKNGALDEFTKAAAQSKAKLIMTPLSYLLCPKQRKIARFMNLSKIIQWGVNILDSFEHMTKFEQEKMQWIKEHEQIIIEMSSVFKKTDIILEKIKKKGLSYPNINSCLEICSERRDKLSDIMALLMEDIYYYLLAERNKLPCIKTVWHASSDIIESLFGKMKAKNPTNLLHGITSSILFLPLLTKIDKDLPQLNVNIKEAMESTFMSEIEAWTKVQLVENQVIRRNKLFKK